KYACAPYYSNDDINKVVPGCADVTGPTNGRARRAVKFARE
ncbi:hypothetical protein JCM10207_008889, partial [Rhodosporidiobolus poonsookiae]